MDLDEIVNSYDSHVKIKKKKNLFRELTSPQATLCFSSNDYLGLSQHSALKLAAQEAIKQHGVGAQASRLLGSMNELFHDFETEIATSKNQSSALIFGSGFQANASVIAALLDRQVLGIEPLVFSDRLNHASIHMGCTAAQVRQIRYQHLDLNHLEVLLKKHKSLLRPKFILTESVFGMDGDVVDIEGLITLAQQFNAFLYVDEAHATGLYGRDGYGLTASWGPHVGVVMGTFSKALGSFGAYIACQKKIYSYLINKCAGFIYATALPPAVVASARAAWHLLPFMTAERDHISMLSTKLRQELNQRGLDTGSSTTHIIPVILKSSELALKVQQDLMGEGIQVSAIRPPTVPPHSARLRIAIRANHSEDHIKHLLSALDRVLHKLL